MQPDQTVIATIPYPPSYLFCCILAHEGAIFV